MVVWLLGLSGAGKSTIAILLKERLAADGVFSAVLDGDELRAGINQDLSFSTADRTENVRRAAEIAKVLAGNRIVTICSFITPLQEHRDLARTIIGEGYFEVFIKCPLEVCEKRDVKGLYKKARAEGISNFTGVTADFEASFSSDLTIFTDAQTPEESSDLLYVNVLQRMGRS